MSQEQQKPKNKMLTELLQKEITRKQFLGMTLTAILGVMGFSGIVGLLTKNAPPSTPQGTGYGKQGYGA